MAENMIKTESKLENNNGRSMLEMLGVLAIIGVLSIGAVTGFKMAINKYQANNILHDASLTLAEIGTLEPAPSAWKKVGFITDSGLDFYGMRTTAGTDLVKVTAVGKDVCEVLLEYKTGTDISGIYGDEAATTELTNCGDNQLMVFAYGSSNNSAEEGSEEAEEESCSGIANCREYNAGCSTCKTCNDNYTLSGDSKSCTCTTIANCSVYDDTCTYCVTCNNGYTASADSKSCIVACDESETSYCINYVDGVCVKEGCCSGTIYCLDYEDGSCVHKSCHTGGSCTPYCDTYENGSCVSGSCCTNGVAKDSNNHDVCCTTAIDHCSTYNADCSCSACTSPYTLSSGACVQAKLAIGEECEENEDCASGICKGLGYYCPTKTCASAGSYICRPINDSRSDVFDFNETYVNSCGREKCLSSCVWVTANNWTRACNIEAESTYFCPVDTKVFSVQTGEEVGSCTCFPDPPYATTSSNWSDLCD